MTPLLLFAPLGGPTLPLDAVPDPVFSQKMMGNGIAIDPITSCLVAPCAGKIIQLHPASHALTLEAASGTQVLLHIGLDTVQLQGEGFFPEVKVGDRVQAGQSLIAFDADLIAQKARSLVSVMIVLEAPKHELVRKSHRLATAGKDVLLELDFEPPTTKVASAARGERSESAVVQVTLPSGLHARPAALLVAAAKKYQSDIEVKKGAGRANAKSLVSVLALEVNHEDFVHFVAIGPDAKRAAPELAAFLRNLKDQVEAAPTAAPATAKRTGGQPNVLVGVSASPGLALGKVQQLRSDDFAVTEAASGSPQEEKAKLVKAVAAAHDEISELKERLKGDAARAAIFDAHNELLEDPTLLEACHQAIDKGKSAGYAWNQAITGQAERLANLNNELMANRANDLRDVGRRVLRGLVGRSGPATKSAPATGSILIAENLTPSDTVQLDRAKILGFCTTVGGATSHVAILARSLGIPAIAGIEVRALEIPDGTEVVLDAELGELRLHPAAEEKQRVEQLTRELAEKRDQALTLAKQPAATKDGHAMQVAANIGNVEDARQAVALGCDGVGLLRSEFLFMDRATAPSEEEQYRVYQEIADVLGDRPLTIRTLDVGGDKPLQYLPIPPEENPFLGVRGIRAGLLHPEVLRTQLRAILRVRSKGKLHVMFPMIATLEEFRAAKAMLLEEQTKLKGASVEVGLMMEVPSAALIADAFAQECDFFSIGTNDLTQYTLAIDRGHKELAKQCDGLHPSVLRLIEMTVQAAHRHGRWVGVCGGLASEAKAVPILVGLGVDELSVSIPSIPTVKSQVRDMELMKAQMLAQKASIKATAKEVREL